MVVKFPCKSFSKKLQICIMPFSVIIATFGYMLNAIRLTHKHNCIKCSEKIYAFLNISNEECFETNQGKNINFKVFT